MNVPSVRTNAGLDHGVERSGVTSNEFGRLARRVDNNRGGHRVALFEPAAYGPNVTSVFLSDYARAPGATPSRYAL